MLRDKNLNYMNKRCKRYCASVWCSSCVIGDALDAATGTHHRCGNGYSFAVESMNSEEICIAYAALREAGK